jgi:hypothetical protein
LHNETHALYGKRRTTIPFPSANQDDLGAFWLVSGLGTLMTYFITITMHFRKSLRMT